MGHNNFVDAPSTPATVDHAYFVHVLLTFMQGQKRLTPEEQEQLITHLSECPTCQKIVQRWLYVELDYEQADDSAALLRGLLAQLEAIINETIICADIGAYIDVLTAQGEEAANATFPKLAQHLRQCKHCHTEVKEIQALLSLLDHES